MDLSNKDRILQNIFPTLMVPKDSDLQPCQIGQTRLLMASDGLYLETERTWGGLRKLLWESPRSMQLPYGEVKEKDDFQDVLNNHIIRITSEIMAPEAARFAESGKEWAGFIVWDGNNFLPWSEATETTGLSVKFLSHGCYNLPEGYSIVADIHSHHRMPPFFSDDDDMSDVGKVKISMVLGNYKGEGNPLFDWVARYCVEGFFLSGNREFSVKDLEEVFVEGELKHGE